MHAEQIFLHGDLFGTSRTSDFPHKMRLSTWRFPCQRLGDMSNPVILFQPRLLAEVSSFPVAIYANLKIDFIVPASTKHFITG
jgi:hypothetical protein